VYFVTCINCSTWYWHKSNFCSLFLYAPCVS